MQVKSISAFISRFRPQSCSTKPNPYRGIHSRPKTLASSQHHNHNTILSRNSPYRYLRICSHIPSPLHPTGRPATPVGNRWEWVHPEPALCGLFSGLLCISRPEVSNAPELGVMCPEGISGNAVADGRRSLSVISRLPTGAVGICVMASRFERTKFKNMVLVDTFNTALFKSDL